MYLHDLSLPLLSCITQFQPLPGPRDYQLDHPPSDAMTHEQPKVEATNPTHNSALVVNTATRKYAARRPGLRRVARDTSDYWVACQHAYIYVCEKHAFKRNTGRRIICPVKTCNRILVILIARSERQDMKIPLV